MGDDRHEAYRQLFKRMNKKETEIEKQLDNLNYQELLDCRLVYQTLVDDINKRIVEMESDN